MGSQGFFKGEKKKKKKGEDSSFNVGKVYVTPQVEIVGKKGKK